MAEAHLWCYMSLWPGGTWGHVTNWKLNISSYKRSMISKLCRVVTYDEGSSPTLSRESLTTYSREVRWQTKNKIYFLVQRLRSSNLVGKWLIMRRTHPQCHMTPWPSNHSRSRDKFETKYLLFHKDYNYQTWQGGDLWWGKLTHNVR